MYKSVPMYADGVPPSTAGCLQRPGWLVSTAFVSAAARQTACRKWMVHCWLVLARALRMRLVAVEVLVGRTAGSGRCHAGGAGELPRRAADRTSVRCPMTMHTENSPVHHFPAWRLSRSAHRHVLSRAAISLLILVALPGAIAQDAGKDARFTVGIEGEFRARSEEAAERRLADAARAARAMSATPAIADLLTRARGVFIVPTYGRAALGVGAAGGSGVLMTRHADGRWGNPAFFTMGGLGIGLQAGAEGGPIALLLMNQDAVDRFRKRNNFSLSAGAGLTVLNYRRMAAGSAVGDVLVWSGGKGVFGNAATISINNIRYNQDLTHAHYGKPISARQAIDSAASDRRALALRAALGEPGQAAHALDK